MARKALLVGTKTYQDGFKTLNSAPYDVQALADLLRNSEVGGFDADDVQVLVDRESSELATQIETWYLQHTQNDFALLFIAGHGVKDYDRRLHFAATNTQKVGERLITTSAVSATDLSGWIRNSKAKRQVVILNCCFSGAFGDLVPMDDGTIDVEEALGAEGRVVMTSTSSMDYAFERQNGKLSVYGHYLAEGLRTGAAVQSSDEITVDDLHQYVSRKVQEEAPAMVPKLFAKGEGYRLRLAKVAIDDPKVKYRRRVEEIVREDGNAIDEVFSRSILTELCAKLQLETGIASEIERAVLEPVRQRNAKRQKYQEFFQRAAQHRYPFGKRENKRIAEYRQMLGLGPEDLAQLEEAILAKYQLSPEPIAESPTETTPLGDSPIKSIFIDSIALESEKWIDYSKLRDLLKAEKWEEADLETWNVMLKAANSESQVWLDPAALKKFPCKDLRTIDELWVIASNGHFGFSVQKQIWADCGSPISLETDWDNFFVKVGWQGSAEGSNALFYSPINSPSGELPFMGWEEKNPWEEKKKIQRN